MRPLVAVAVGSTFLTATLAFVPPRPTPRGRPVVMGAATPSDPVGTSDAVIVPTGTMLRGSLLALAPDQQRLEIYGDVTMATINGPDNKETFTLHVGKTGKLKVNAGVLEATSAVVQGKFSGILVRTVGR